MLKLYVETMIRLNGSTQRLKSSAKERLKGESGFVSAETIGLAVAGVAIVGVVYVAFKTAIDDQVGGLLDRMFNPDGTTETP